MTTTAKDVEGQDVAAGSQSPKPEVAASADDTATAVPKSAVIEHDAPQGNIEDGAQPESAEHKPESAEQLEPKPESAEQPEPKTESAEQPEPKPESAEQPLQEVNSRGPSVPPAVDQTPQASDLVEKEQSNVSTTAPAAELQSTPALQNEKTGHTTPPPLSAAAVTAPSTAPQPVPPPATAETIAPLPKTATPSSPKPPTPEKTMLSSIGSEPGEESNIVTGNALVIACSYSIVFYSTM